LGCGTTVGCDPSAGWVPVFCCGATVGCDPSAGWEPVLSGAEGSAVFCVTFALLAIGGAEAVFVVGADALFVGVAVASGALV
jgi:hypothetical protein